MELIINEKVYNFKFGIGFVRHLDGKSSIKMGFNLELDWKH